MTPPSPAHGSCAITGVGMSAFVTRRPDQDLFGLQCEVAELALRDAGLEMDDIDAVVLAQGPEVLHGLGQPEQLSVGALGVRGRPTLRAHTGGATGASAAELGWWAVASGRFRHVLVLGAEKMGDGTRGAQEALNKIWDPAYESLLPLNTITMSALHAVRHMHRYGTSVEQYARIAARLRRNGAANETAHLRNAITADDVLRGPWLSWPIARDMACPRSSGGCAIVMSGPEAARRLSAPKAWIHGMASQCNTYFMGDRMGNHAGNDYGSFDDLERAAAAAYRRAGIRDPFREVHVAEPYVPFSVVEPAILESLGLAEPGQAAQLGDDGCWDVDGLLPVCPSGGTLCTNPISVTALVRIAEAALQVRRRAGNHQVERADRAVATGVGGSYQFWVVAVLAADPRPA